MAELKNHGSDDRSELKRADAEKSFAQPTPNPLADGVSVKLGDSIATSPRAKKKAGRLPLIVDIITGVLLVAIVVGISVGAVYLFRYYADDYEGVDVEYTFICVSDDIEDFNSRALRNKGIFLDTEDNTLYFGDVVSAEMYDLQNEAGENMLVVVVQANVKYKDGVGYTVNGQRIAVGSEYLLRCESMLIDGTIVELEPMGSQTVGGR